MTDLRSLGPRTRFLWYFTAALVHAVACGVFAWRLADGPLHFQSKDLPLVAGAVGVAAAVLAIPQLGVLNGARGTRWLILSGGVGLGTLSIWVVVAAASVLYLCARMATAASADEVVLLIPFMYFAPLIGPMKVAETSSGTIFLLGAALGLFDAILVVLSRRRASATANGGSGIGK